MWPSKAVYPQPLCATPRRAPRSPPPRPLVLTHPILEQSKRNQSGHSRQPPRPQALPLGHGPGPGALGRHQAPKGRDLGLGSKCWDRREGGTGVRAWLQRLKRAQRGGTLGSQQLAVWIVSSTTREGVDLPSGVAAPWERAPYLPAPPLAPPSWLS